MMKKVLIIVAISLSSLLLIVYYSFHYLRNKEINDLEKKGEALALKVEAYKERKHKIPQYLEDMKLNLPDDYLLNYNITKDSGIYLISFQVGFFKSMVYHSDTKKWEYEN